MIVVCRVRWMSVGTVLGVPSRSRLGWGVLTSVSREEELL